MLNIGLAPNDGPELRPLGGTIDGVDNLGGLIAPNTNGALFVVEVDIGLNAELLPNGIGAGAAAAVAVDGVKVKLFALVNIFAAEDVVNGLAELAITEVGIADDTPNVFEVTPVLVGNVGANGLDPEGNTGGEVDGGINAGGAVAIVDDDEKEVPLGTPKDSTAGIPNGAVETVDVAAGVVVALEIAVDIGAKG